MATLEEQLDDAVAEELARIRAELREAILRSGMTQEKVCAYAGIARSTLADFLGGRSAIGTESLARLLVITGATMVIEVPGVVRPLRIELPERGRSRSSGASHASGQRNESDSPAPQKGTRYRAKKAKRSGRTGTEGASNRCTGQLSARPACSHSTSWRRCASTHMKRNSAPTSLNPPGVRETAVTGTAA